ncbi:MAG: DUF2891 domain-containing protein, partial [Candidatus Eremiobacteraeota bacterium]|nr:DUF2891 domain-containing protein [Candidatus Eremiobacteraeota bacterium]
MTQIDRSLAARFARIALGHLEREYPNKLDHVLNGPDDARSPRALHPAFYGSFDWHSSVHGHWLVATLLRLAPGLDEAAAIRALLDRHLTRENLAAEAAYLARPGSATFERPYGWAWLLMLAAEFARHEDADGRRWSEDLAPLREEFVARFRAWLPIATYPVRSGAHGNTAFALALALEYADTVHDEGFAAELRTVAQGWYGGDRDAPAWEPSGEDFLSPTLVEAECMRRTLSAPAFRPWLDRFLPRLALREPAALFAPVSVSDRRDGRIAHLDGLNLSRAWCFRALASACAPAEPLRPLLNDAADAHLTAALPHLADDYMGAHWT